MRSPSAEQSGGSSGQSADNRVIILSTAKQTVVAFPKSLSAPHPSVSSSSPFAGNLIDLQPRLPFRPKHTHPRPSPASTSHPDLAQPASNPKMVNTSMRVPADTGAPLPPALLSAQSDTEIERVRAIAAVESELADQFLSWAGVAGARVAGWIERSSGTLDVEGPRR